MSDEKDFELLNANIGEVLKTRAGRAVIWEILSLCHIYTDNSLSADQGIEGKRAVGLEILAMLSDADPTIYPKLMLEQDENNG